MRCTVETMNTIQLKPINTLEHLIEEAHYVVCNKIANGEIEVSNEASLQMQLGAILNTLGSLYRFSPLEQFVVNLEVPHNLLKPTLKSSKVARCDIEVMIKSIPNGDALAMAFIELKYFRKDDRSDETVTDNRFSVYKDIQNLEGYIDLYPAYATKLLCYEIVLTNNVNYASSSSTSQIRLGDGEHTGLTKAAEKNNSRYPVNSLNLRKNYSFHWTKFAPDLFSLLLKL